MLTLHTERGTKPSPAHNNKMETNTIKYYIELNGKYIKEYSRKTNALKWVENYMEATRLVDHEEYPTLIRIWKCEDFKDNVCLYEIKVDSNKTTI